MRCCALLIGAGAAVFAMAAGAGTAPYHVYADVVDVEPLIERHTVSVPSRDCFPNNGSAAYSQHHYSRHDRSDAHSTRSRRSGVAGILGGVIGGLVGSQFGGGNGKKALAIGGALLGASSARRASRHRHESEYVRRRCATVMESRVIEEVAGYRVHYLYHGQEFVKRVDSDPGDRILVEVRVMPVATDPNR